MKQKLLIVAIVVLVLVNITLLVVVWKGQVHNLKNRRPNNTPEHFMMKKLGFSSEQKEKMSELRKDHFSQVRSLEKAIMDKRQELFLNEVEDGDLGKSLDEISSLQRKIDSITFLHFQNIRSICEPNQIDTFNEFLKELNKGRFAHGPRRRAAPDMEK